MNHKYVVTLTEEERLELKELVQKGKTQGYRIRHAQILLKLDDIPENAGWTYDKIWHSYNATPHTIRKIAQRFVCDGLEAALGRKEQQNRRRKVDGEVEAHIIAIACSEAPEGRERWTLQLIADKLVSLGVVDSISDTAVCNTLKKTNLSLGRKKSGASPNRGLSL
jgi:transposase